VKPIAIAEQSIHEAVVQLLRFTALPGVIAYHPANGEARGARTGAKLKRMGVVAGVADLALVLPGGRAAFLEIKGSAGRQSPEQRGFEAAARQAGALYAVARSVDEAHAVLKGWGAVR